MSKCLPILTAAALLALAVSAKAQSIQPPWPYNPILGTAPVQVLPIDPVRRRIIFQNPSATATLAFCPSGVTRAGVTFACAVHGAGSITILPMGSFTLDGGTPQGPALSMGAAWIGVADSANSPATLLEFE